MNFADIHFHGLWGVDDGPQTERDMYKMLDVAYAEGTRLLCVTPHYHPGYFRDNQAQTMLAFEQLSKYAKERFADLRLFLGNELRYDQGADSWLESGRCRTINGTGYILVDFRADEKQVTILKAMNQLMNYGYTPILAHAERYRALNRDLRDIRELRSNGVLIQLDGMSMFGGFGLEVKLVSRKLLKYGLVDMISSDAHDTVKRPPVMKKSYDYVAKHYGDDYARALCCECALRILIKDDEGKGID